MKKYVGKIINYENIGIIDLLNLLDSNIFTNFKNSNFPTFESYIDYRNQMLGALSICELSDVGNLSIVKDEKNGKV